MSDWNPEAVKQAFDMELDHGVLTESGEVVHKTPEQMAVEDARNSVGYAMRRIIHIACYSENESRAMDAARYIVDRVLGKGTDVPLSANDNVEDALTSILDSAYGSRN